MALGEWDVPLEFRVALARRTAAHMCYRALVLDELRVKSEHPHRCFALKRIRLSADPEGMRTGGTEIR